MFAIKRVVKPKELITPQSFETPKFAKPGSSVTPKLVTRPKSSTIPNCSLNKTDRDNKLEVTPREVATHEQFEIAVHIATPKMLAIPKCFAILEMFETPKQAAIPKMFTEPGGFTIPKSVTIPEKITVNSSKSTGKRSEVPKEGSKGPPDITKDLKTLPKYWDDQTKSSKAESAFCRTKTSIPTVGEELVWCFGWDKLKRALDNCLPDDDFIPRDSQRRPGIIVHDHDVVRSQSSVRSRGSRNKG